jgi:hypothetical protein
MEAQVICWKDVADSRGIMEMSDGGAVMLVGERRRFMMRGDLLLEGGHRRGHRLGRSNNDDKVRLPQWRAEKVYCR